MIRHILFAATASALLTDPISAVQAQSGGSIGADSRPSAFIGLPDGRTSADSREAYATAFEWYRAAAQAGDATAQYFLGLQYERGIRGAPDMTRAAAWHEKAAAQGLAEAQYRMGRLCAEGAGVAKDLAAAVRWYEMAAGQGMAEAAYNLAVLYETGAGVERDPARAAALYLDAARKGLAPAKVAFAMLRARGAGVERDPVDALAWLLAAQTQPDGSLAAVADALAQGLTDQERAAAHSLAEDYAAVGRD